MPFHPFSILVPCVSLTCLNSILNEWKATFGSGRTMLNEDKWVPLWFANKTTLIRATATIQTLFTSHIQCSSCHPNNLQTKLPNIKQQQFNFASTQKFKIHLFRPNSLKTKQPCSDQYQIVQFQLSQQGNTHIHTFCQKNM